MKGILEIPLENVVADPGQPRKYFDSETIETLARSIEKHGLLQPILVRPFDNGDYQIVHGERRYRAHQLLGWKTIKAEVKELTDEQVQDIRLIENLERNDLTDIELAWEFERRVKAGQTHEQIARTIHRTRAFVTQRLALLKLSKKDQMRMLRGELSFSNARLLLSIKDPNVRAEVSSQVTKDTTVKATLSLVKPNVTRVTSPAPNPISGPYVNVRELAVYPIITGDDKVPIWVLVRAYIQDLKRLRGS